MDLRKDEGSVADDSARAHLAWLEHGDFFQRNLPRIDQHEMNAAELAGFVADSLDRLQLFPAEATWRKHVPQITLFTYLCAPHRASARGLEAATEMLFVFFLLDDYGSELDLSPNPGELTDDARRRLSFIDDWLGSLKSRFSRDPGRFIEGLARFRAALRIEAQYVRDRKELTLDEFTDRETGRFQWVGTPPYIDLWELTEGISIPPEHRAACDSLKAIGVELTYIANDIGSVARDRQSGEPNYVSLIGRERGLPLAAALECVTEHYLDQVAHFRREVSHLPPSEELASYASLVAHVTDGNLRATARLASSDQSQRYAESTRGHLNALLEGGLLART